MLPALIASFDHISEEGLIEKLKGMTDMDRIVSILTDHYIRPVENYALYEWESASAEDWFNDLYSTMGEQFERGLERAQNRY